MKRTQWIVLGMMMLSSSVAVANPLFIVDGKTYQESDFSLEEKSSVPSHTIEISAGFGFGGGDAGATASAEINVMIPLRFITVGGHLGGANRSSHTESQDTYFAAFLGTKPIGSDSSYLTVGGLVGKRHITVRGGNDGVDDLGFNFQEGQSVAELWSMGLQARGVVAIRKHSF